MKMIKMDQPNQFGLVDLSFLELKTIKDACLEYAKQGSSAALTLAKKINQEMNQMTI